jgi:hypothetical protein
LVRVPSSLRELVGSSAAPLAVLELPSSEVLAANEAMARALRVWPKPQSGRAVTYRKIGRHAAVYARSIADGCAGTLKPWEHEAQRGREHSGWLAWARSGGDCGLAAGALVPGHPPGPRPHPPLAPLGSGSQRRGDPTARRSRCSHRGSGARAGSQVVTADVPPPVSACLRLSPPLTTTCLRQPGLCGPWCPARRGQPCPRPKA